MGLQGPSLNCSLPYKHLLFISPPISFLILYTQSSSVSFLSVSTILVLFLSCKDLGKYAYFGPICPGKDQVMMSQCHHLEALYVG